MRTSAEQLESWLVKNGYRQNFFVRYGQWLGVVPKQPDIDPATGKATPRFSLLQRADRAALFRHPAGRFRLLDQVQDRRSSAKLFPALGATGILMFWVMVTMVPIALLVGILAGMREGSRTDRTLSVASIATTATPEYVSGVIFTVHLRLLARLAQRLGRIGDQPGHHLLQFHAAGDDHGDLRHRLHRPHDARLDGRGDDAAIYPHRAPQGPELRAVVVKHALRNALIAPFTVIMLQFPWLLTGVVIVETMFRYQGFGFTLVEAAGNNDIDLLLGCSLVSVFVVLFTQLISDIGYAYLNPRIRVQ